jgi:geranylgeranyl pyrophosphate synthase
MSATAGASALQAVIAAGGPELGGLMAEVEDRLARLATGHGAELARYGGDTISAGGKRLRPLLVCLAAGDAVVDRALLVRAAAAIELIHAASLVHDDVLDRSPERRGRPTVVAAGGPTMALATGDLLFSRAFAELVPSGSVEAVRILSRASSALVTGELMQRADAYRTDVSLERYLERCRLKTAVLFRAACELGVLAAGGPPPSLGEFGEAIGVAFQILDDVLDVSGPPERTGKPRGTDLLDGTVTLPFVLARERDPELAALDLRTVRGTEKAAAVCDRIAASGALELCRERGWAMVDAAKGLLRDIDRRRATVLALVADGVVERYA